MSLEVCYTTLLNLLVFQKPIPSWGENKSYSLSSHTAWEMAISFCLLPVTIRLFQRASWCPLLAGSPLLEGLAFLTASQMTFPMLSPLRPSFRHLPPGTRPQGVCRENWNHVVLDFGRFFAPCSLSSSWAKGTLGWFLGGFCDNMCKWNVSNYTDNRVKHLSLCRWLEF